MVSTKDAKKRIETDETFVNIKRFEYSLKKLLERYPNGCPNKVIAQALLITEDDVEEEYNKIVTKLRTLMGVEL